MGLTILQVAYPFAPVGPDAIGGAEQIVSALDRILVEEGHRSLVLACAGSHVRGELIAVPMPSSLLTPEIRAAHQAAYRETLEGVLRRHRVDLIHYHGVDFHTYQPETSTPSLATLHLPPEWYPPAVFEARPNRSLQCVSNSQRLRCPRSLALVDDIPNGVDLTRFRPTTAREDFALMLGRICHEKGVHLALEAARAADIPLQIAGRVFPYPEHERYFEEQVRPLLDRERRFIGPVAMPEKGELLARARCLVVASTVAETSSLVSMEALASGTPVVALRHGALDEVVSHGRTGFLADSLDELIEGLKKAQQLRGEECRREAERRFCDKQMGASYLELYRKLRRAPHGAPRSPASEISVLSPRAVRAVPVEVAELHELDQLEAVEEEWRALFQRCSRATVFQRPEWLIPWARHLNRGALCVVKLHKRARLIGLAPLFVWRLQDAYVLSLMGAGVSDYQGVLFEDAEEEACVSAFERWLQRSHALWDRLEWSELDADSPLWRIRLRGCLEHRMHQDTCPAVVFPGRASSLSDVLPHAQFQKVSYARRRAERDLGVIHEEVCPDTFDETFSALERLHTERCASRGRTKTLSDPRIKAFHEDAARRLLHTRSLLLERVRLDGQIASVLYGFHDRTATRYYLGGFEPRFSKYSPGLLSTAYALESALRRGAHRFDFLRGREPYKYTWGAKDDRQITTWIAERRLADTHGTSPHAFGARAGQLEPSGG